MKLVVSVPVEDRSQQSATFAHALRGPTLMYPLTPMGDQYLCAHSLLN
jgi:hypothetical protein